MEILIITIMVIAILWQIVRFYKSCRANWRLAKIYQRRHAEEKRTRKLITERPEGVIFVSDLWKMEEKHTLHYIGKFDYLGGFHSEDWDFVTVNRIEYLRLDGKWYELVNDMTRFDHRII